MNYTRVSRPSARCTQIIVNAGYFAFFFFVYSLLHVENKTQMHSYKSKDFQDESSSKDSIFSR